MSNNSFQIDGVSVNSLCWGGAAVVTPNQESVKEVRVVSSSYSAEDGRNSGAQVKVVSQNGTNDLHGSGLFKYNDPGLNSFNKYGATTGNVNINAPPVRVERRFRQFGGSLGGPIYLPRFGEGGPAYYSGKNRLFFFFSYEGLRERTNNTYNFYVETPQYRQSILALRPNTVTGQILNSSGILPRMVQTLPADCSVYGSNAAAQCRVVAGGLDIGSLTGAPRQYVAPATGGGFGLAYNRVPNVLSDNTRGNPPFFARNSLCCGSATNPFAGGTIFYTLWTSRSVLSYPVNPALSRGLDPATNGIIGRTVEIYGTPSKLPNSCVYLFSLDTQYELPLSLTATLGYQGSAGHKLIRIVNQNILFQNSTFFNPVFFLTPDVNSNYHTMNARVERRFSHGVQFVANYRWAKSIDTLSYEGPGFVTNQTFPQNLSTERGPSDYDVRHYFVLSGLWDLPIFRTRSDFLGKAFGGWQLSGIVTRNTGFPWTPVTNRPALTTPGGRNLSPIRPISYTGGALNDSSNEAFIRPGGNFPGGGDKFFVITGTAQRPGIGRNSFRGSQYFSVDLSVGKETGLPKFLGLGEAAKLDFRANFFNAFNKLNLQHIQFGSAGALIENPNFGRSPAGLAGRIIEFRARFSF